MFANWRDYLPWMIMVPIQIAWLSIPFWVAYGRTRRMRALAARRKFHFQKTGLPQEFPFSELFPDDRSREARNVVSGLVSGDILLAFDLGSPYSRNQRPQTMVARFRAGNRAALPPPATAAYAMRTAGNWVLIYNSRGYFGRLVQGAISPMEIERLWAGLE